MERNRNGKSLTNGKGECKRRTEKSAPQAKKKLRAATANPSSAAAHAQETRSSEGREAERESSQGQVSMMRHKVNGAMAARAMQMSLTDRGAQGVAGVCSLGAARNAFAASRGHKTVPPSPKEMSSIACPTRWTHVHHASTSGNSSDGRKCASTRVEGVAAGSAGVRKKYDVSIGTGSSSNG